MRILSLLEELKGKVKKPPKIDSCILNGNWYCTVVYTPSYSERDEEYERIMYDATFRFMNDYCIECMLYGKQDVAWFENVAKANKIKIERWSAWYD